MRLPDKVTSYKKSIIAKFPLVLEELQKENMTPRELYNRLKLKIKDISELTDILACLYMLNKIDFIDDEMLCYIDEY